MHILQNENVQILLFWNNSVDVPAFISCWKNLLHDTLVMKCFRSSLKKYAHILLSSFLLSQLLKSFRKEKHFPKNQLYPCLQPLFLNFVLLKRKELTNFEFSSWSDHLEISDFLHLWGKFLPSNLSKILYALFDHDVRMESNQQVHGYLRHVEPSSYDALNAS